MSGRAVVIGGSGRLGATIVAGLGRADAPLSCVATAGRQSSNLGELLAACDVYIDVSSPAGTAAAATAALGRGCAAVIGTTGLDAAALAALDKLAATAPVLVAANFSLGVNLLLAMAAKASASLAAWDVEIVEAHHRHKRDAPSGTALALAHVVADARGWPASAVVAERNGNIGPRGAQEIGVATLRGGDVVGEHTVMLLGGGERLELSHRATDRGVFAKGAIAAAAWLVGKAPGRYTMRDVLDLNT